jgi:hypothetical protein
MQIKNPKFRASVIEAVRVIDDLPDSATVRTAVIAVHQDSHPATIYRKSKSGLLPPIIGGRMNVGAYRRAIASTCKKMA